MNIHILASTLWYTNCQPRCLFSRQRIQTYVLQHSGKLCAKRGFFFSSLSVLTAATPTIKCTMNHSVHQKTTGYSSQVISSGPSDNVQGTLPFIRKQQGFLFFTSSSNGNHTNHKRYSDPIRPQENNSVFFTSNSNGVSPIRRSTLNHSVHQKTTGCSSQVIRMTFTPIRQSTVNHSVHQNTIGNHYVHQNCMLNMSYDSHAQKNCFLNLLCHTRYSEPFCSLRQYTVSL